MTTDPATPSGVEPAALSDEPTDALPTEPGYWAANGGVPFVLGTNGSWWPDDPSDSCLPMIRLYTADEAGRKHERGER